MSLVEFVEIYALFGRTKQTQNLCAEDQIQFLGLGLGGPGLGGARACLIFGNMKSYLKQLAHHRLNVLANIALPEDKRFDKIFD